MALNEKYKKELISIIQRYISNCTIYLFGSRALDFELGLLNEKEAELALQMIKDCSLSAHIYVEEVAEHILHGVPDYYQLMQQTTLRLKPN